MTRKPSMSLMEYAEYEAAVARFFESEGIRNLSPVDPESEPFFSWRPCDCCQRPLGGNREHVNGYNPTTEQIQEYTVCEDCIYYAAYNRLDDTTMAELEDQQ